jgi:hypothetical protein
MNSKSIVKRTLPLIIALAIIIIIAVSCTLLSGEKPNPRITDPQGAFMKIEDIEIQNNQIYNDLKLNYGYNTLLEMLDIKLLGQEKDNNDQPYYVTIDKRSEAFIDEIDEKIEEAMFPNGRTGDTEDDADTITEWKEKVFLSLGLKDDNAIKEYYNLVISRENYTRDAIRKNYEESIASDDIDDTITEDDIDSYFDANYQNTFWTIVVPYNSLEAAETALNQIDIELKTVDNKTTWVKGGTDIELTAEEVKQAFIDLYNNQYSYKAVGYPNAANPIENLVVRNGVHYTIEGGNIVFNTEYNEDLEADNIQTNSNLFYLTTSDLNKINANLGKYVNDSMRAINNPASELPSTFTANPKTFSGASNYYLILKIDYEQAPLQSEVEAEIIEKIIENRVSSEQN